MRSIWVLAVVLAFIAGSIVVTTSPASATIQDDISDLFQRMSDVESLALTATNVLDQILPDISELFQRMNDVENKASQNESDIESIKALAKGDTGDPGPTQSLETNVRTSATVVISSSKSSTITASCLAGEKATSGGWNLVKGSVKNLLVVSSSGTASSWIIDVFHRDVRSETISVQASVVCAKLVGP